MRIDIIEVKPKTKKKKIILIALLGIATIIIFSILGIFCAKKYKQNIIEGNKKAEVSMQKNGKNNESNLQETYSEYAKEKMNSIYSKDTKIAYLTFDDGPSQAITPLILDILKEENIKATFFVLGSNVKKNPDIVKRAYQEGHYIANHGYSHSYKKIYKNAKAVLEEYNKTEKQIQKAIDNENYSSSLFRFPGGYEGGKYQDIKIEAGKILNENNIFYLDWNVLTGDAQGANTKEKILKNIKKYTKDKGNIVVLMHDSSSKILTYETLKKVIKYLRDEGYTFQNFYEIIK